MGQPIFGHSHPLAYQVVLDCDPKLVGDSLSIHLSQPGGSVAVWTIDVWVQIAQGEFFVGRLVTTSPAAGDNPSRTIGIATIPGAIGWSVQAICTTDGEEADLTLQSSRCCASALGLVKLGPTGPTDDDPWSNIFSIALANTFVISAAAGILRSITLRVDSTLASGTYYVQLWNSAAVPADTTATTLANSLAAPVKIIHTSGANDVIRYDFDEFGIAFTAGASLNLSSTEFTKTTVAGAFISVTSAEYR